MHDLMPPEARYRPRSSYRGSVIGTFFFVFGTVFAALWFTTSLWPAFVLLGVFFGRSFFQRAAHTTAVQRNQTAVNLLNAGRVDEAGRIFEDLSDSERNTAAHPVYVFNRAVAYVLQGRPRRAYSLFNAVDRSGAFTFGFASSYLPLLYIEIGTCLALMGQLEAAREFRHRISKSLDRGDWGRVVFLDALLLVRTGDHEAAQGYIREHWRAAEGMLRVPTMKALRLIHAFSLARLGREPTPEFRSLVEGVRPCRSGEFDWIGAEWPEMLAFLQGQGLR